MTHEVVNRDAGGEGHTTLELLALLASESLFDLLLDHVVDGTANRGNVGTWDGELNSLGKAR